MINRSTLQQNKQKAHSSYNLKLTNTEGVQIIPDRVSNKSNLRYVSLVIAGELVI